MTGAVVWTKLVLILNANSGWSERNLVCTWPAKQITSVLKGLEIWKVVTPERNLLKPIGNVCVIDILSLLLHMTKEFYNKSSLKQENSEGIYVSALEKKLHKLYKFLVATRFSSHKFICFILLPNMTKGVSEQIQSEIRKCRGNL